MSHPESEITRAALAAILETQPFFQEEKDLWKLAREGLDAIVYQPGRADAGLTQLIRIACSEGFHGDEDRKVARAALLRFADLAEGIGR